MKAIFKWINILLSIGLFFIALGILYVAIPYFGNQALIVRSGSMAPAIDAGSIVVIRPETGLIAPQDKIHLYNKDDIIAFRGDSNPETIITHRILGVKVDKNDVLYKTKGDANDDVDGWIVSEGNVLGKAYFTLPLFGYLLAFTKSNIGFSLLVIFPAVLVIFLEIAAIYKEIRKQKRALQFQLPSGVNSTSLKVLLPIIMLIFVFERTFAFFSDSETSTNNTFTAAQSFTVPTSIPTPTPTPTPDLSGIANHVVISEVQIATSGATTSDFVEFYNPTSSNINLDGFHLEKRTSTGISSVSLKAFSSSNIIPGHGFYLWASSDGEYATQIGADVSTGENIADNNSIALLDSSDVIVDAVAWGSGHVAPLVESSAFSTNPPDNNSLERKALSTSDATSMTSGSDVSKGNGFDLDNNSTDFILRTLSQPQNSSNATESP